MQIIFYAKNLKGAKPFRAKTPAANRAAGRLKTLDNSFAQSYNIN